MRVAFDITPQLSAGGGVARYLAELTAALERAGATVDRFAFGRATEAPPPGTRHVRVPARFVYPLWRRMGLPHARLLAPRADLIHGGVAGLPRTGIPLVATVHDLDALAHPTLHPARSVRGIASLVSTLHRADMVIVDSAHVAAGLRERGIGEARIAVVHLGVTPLPAAVEPRIDGPFMLAVGRLMPRKGFDLLLRAFARARLGDLDGHRLVIAGPPGIQADDLLRLRLRLGLGDRVLFAGSVSDAELAGLYEQATAVCAPSVAEGFGLPVLEALAAGTPVVASDLAVFREVSGGHVRFVPSDDEQAWASALTEITTDPSLRKRLAADGRAWAARFTWDRTAAETIAVYRRALSVSQA